MNLSIKQLVNYTEIFLSIIESILMWLQYGRRETSETFSNSHEFIQYLNHIKTTEYLQAVQVKNKFMVANVCRNYDIF